MKLKQYTLVAGLAGLLTLSACATDDPHKRAKIGARSRSGQPNQR